MNAIPQIPKYLNLLEDQYEIIEDLTPHKGQGSKTYLAFFSSDISCTRVILKELDEKRTDLYERLLCMWNPYTANTLFIHKLPSGIGSSAPVSIAAIEYAGDISLAQYIIDRGPLSEDAALNVCIQLSRALSRIHSCGIVHRDIKPENIIIPDPADLSVKLIDFGSATIRPQRRYMETNNQTQPLFGDTTVVGTIGYQSPESLSDRTTNRSDIYSIGCLLNFMLNGSEPGSVRYHGKRNIRYILRKSINADPSMRFRSVDELERICRHERRDTFFYRLPLLLSIPGFRSHTRWKSVVACLYYILMAYELIVLLLKYPFHNFIITAVFWLMIPLILIGNLGYLCECLPYNILLNNRVFILFRAVVFLICLFVPLLFY